MLNNPFVKLAQTIIMKKVLKWLGIIIGVVALFAIGGITYLSQALPDVGDAPDLKVDITPQRVERGQYLANCVTVCMDCHSTRDWSQFAGPLVPGTEGIGGERFDRTMGFPGIFYSKNITPSGIGSWTDGEIYRAITCGVDRNNDALFPVMPYHYYGKMADEDIYSIIAYIRSLPAQESAIPAREVDFPVSIIMNTMPKKGTPASIPEPTDMKAYGAYLVNASGCRECHTKADDKGQVLPEFEFAGGRTFELPAGLLTTPNITPHNTGLGYWSQQQFIAKFKSYRDSSYTSPKIDFMNEYNTIMPWMMYSGMSERDLAAIYEYLRTIKPIENQPVKWQPRAKATAMR